MWRLTSLSGQSIGHSSNERGRLGCGLFVLAVVPAKVKTQQSVRNVTSRTAATGPAAYLFSPKRREISMKTLKRSLDRMNRWWILRWLNQWWLRAAMYLNCMIWSLDRFLPNSGISEFKLPAFYIWKTVVVVTAVVQGTMWLWRGAPRLRNYW